MVYSCIFSINSNKNGGAFSFALNLLTLENNIYIQNSSFLMNKADIQGGVLFFEFGFIYLNFTIKTSFFKQNMAKNSMYRLFNY